MGFMNKSKRLISDEELLRAAKVCRSNSAFNELLKRYTFYCKALAAKQTDDFKRTGIRREEVEQVALVSFYTAYKKINYNAKCFYLYWEKIATRDIRMYYAENSYLEGGRCFAGASFDENCYDDNDHYTISDSIGENDSAIQREILINDLMLAINNKGVKLNEKEKTVIIYYLKELTFKEISEKMELPLSTIYSIFNNATKKLRKYIE